MANVELKFRIEAGERYIDASVRVTSEPIRPRDLLPIILPFTNAVVGLSEAACHDRGEAVSCRSGCAACCYQLVPVSEPEAAHLAAVVAALPPQRRESVTERFRLAQELGSAALEHVHATSGEDRVAALAAAARGYFEIGIACPFLEDQSCGIYEDRPAVCREYMVTSSPEFCATLDMERTERVPVPVTVSSTLIYFGDNAAEPGVMPLTDALEWAANTNSQRTEPVPGDALMRRFLQLFRESPSSLR